jgi:hypothetical protein
MPVHVLTLKADDDNWLQLIRPRSGIIDTPCGSIGPRQGRSIGQNKT